MKHIISVLVENKFGVLAQVSTLFSSRGFNIESLAVAKTNDPTISRMTITVNVEERLLEQVEKQLHKLINVIKVQDLTGKSYLERELIFVKIDCPKDKQEELLQVANAFGAKVIDTGSKSLMLELTGDNIKIKNFLKLIEGFKVKDVVRTGQIAVAAID